VQARLLRAMTFGAEQPLLSASEALILLMTVETLLFAGLAVSLALAAPSEHGGNPIVRGPKLAWSISGAILIVSIGAAMAWLDIFTGKQHWPVGFRAWAIAIAVAAGIIVPSVLSGWISKGIE
jgi:hypothetical protein